MQHRRWISFDLLGDRIRLHAGYRTTGCLRLGTQDPLNDERCFCTMMHRTQVHVKSRSYQKELVATAQPIDRLLALVPVPVSVLYRWHIAYPVTKAPIRRRCVPDGPCHGAVPCWWRPSPATRRWRRVSVLMSFK
jgi:hypothetical protein